MCALYCSIENQGFACPFILFLRVGWELVMYFRSGLTWGILSQLARFLYALPNENDE